MVTVITSLAGPLKDLGLSMATVQKAEITHSQVSTLFWVNAALGVLIALATVAFGPIIARFYGEPRLLWITLVLSLSFVFSGLAVQHQALLSRQMRFTMLAAIPVIAMGTGVMAAIIAASLGAGLWALVIMEITRSAISALSAWLACRWRPGWPRRGAGVRDMLRFGTNFTGFSMLNYVARNFDNVLIGRTWGAASLGFYSKAYGLLMLPINQVTGPISKVAIPTLSRLQNDPQRYQHYYYRAINFIASITMPVIATLAARSEEVILLVLGKQWVGVAPIFRVLACAAVLQPVVSPVGWVYVSLNQTDRMMRWSLIAAPLTIASFLLGLPWGALGVATAYTISSVSLTLPTLWWAFRYSPLSIRRWGAATFRPLSASLCLYLAIEVFNRGIMLRNPVLVLVFSCLVAVGVFATLSISWRRMRAELLANLRLLGSLRRSEWCRRGETLPCA
jgi:PST family polysaccharide transporter